MFATKEMPVEQGSLIDDIRKLSDGTPNTHTLFGDNMQDIKDIKSAEDLAIEAWSNLPLQYRKIIAKDLRDDVSPLTNAISEQAIVNKFNQLEFITALNNLLTSYDVTLNATVPSDLDFIYDLMSLELTFKDSGKLILNGWSSIYCGDLDDLQKDLQKDLDDLQKDLDGEGK